MHTLYGPAYCIIRNKRQFNIAPGHPMYCCQSWIDNYINDDRVPISYEPSGRYYYIVGLKTNVWVQIFDKCLLCKKKFPRDLCTQRDKILEKEYGIDHYKTPRPEEFKSEEWWRKRGL